MRGKARDTQIGRRARSQIGCRREATLAVALTPPIECSALTQIGCRRIWEKKVSIEIKHNVGFENINNMEREKGKWTNEHGQ